MKLARLSVIAGILAWATLASAQEQVRCKDGTMSEAGRGACSHHGGVAKEAAPSAAKPTPAVKPAAKPAAAPAAATVRCTDGTMSEAGRGACSHHGGVAKEGAAKAAPAAPVPTARTAPTTPASTKAPAPAPTAATVRCTDGTMSAGGQGACSHHGGIAKEAAPAGKAPPAPPAKPTAAAPAAPPAATVRCTDGTMSAGGQGACSHHGGIAKDVAAAPAPPARPAPAPPPPSASPAPPVAPTPAGQPTARCKDGTLSYSQHHSGTCSNHGGVAAWLDGTKQ